MQQQTGDISQNFGVRLRQLRGDRSQAEFSRYLGFENQQSYQRYEAGRIPNGETLIAISQKLGVSVDFLLTGTEVSGRVSEEAQGTYGAGTARMIPVISWAHAGEAEAYEELPTEWQRQVGTECRDPKAFGLELRGDSMEPKYQEGDVAIVAPSNEVHTGELVVAKLRDNGVCFKIFNAPKGLHYRLTSYNAVYLPLELPRSGFHWIYPVYEVRRNTLAKNRLK